MLGIAARFSCAKYLGPIPTLLSHAKNMPYSGSYFVLEQIFAMMAADLFEHQSSSQKLVFTVVPPSIQRVMSGWYLPASLAFSLAKRFRGRYSGLLKRSKNVPKQASLDAVQRRTNLANCFIPQKKLLRTNLADAHIVIVDDVSTTGASLAESWRCLETMGAKQITAISLAHAPLRGNC
jgi:predicted amidophosphoribosyltransferase